MNMKTKKTQTPESRVETGPLSIGDAVVFRGDKRGEQYYIATADENDHGEMMFNLDNAEGSACGVYYRGELMRVPSQFADRIKELEAQNARMRRDLTPSLVVAAPELLAAAKEAAFVILQTSPEGRFAALQKLSAAIIRAEAK